eukprot:Hpha_TRINITY_DN16588_c1_g3::TRINITY_DN16588_c1_g3_i1::g.133896::m.133896
MLPDPRLILVTFASFLPTVSATVVPPPCAVKTLHVSQDQTCIRNFDHGLACWGRNPSTDCRLGLGDSDNRGDTPGSMGSNLPFIKATASSGDPGVALFSVGVTGGCFVLFPTSLAEPKCFGDGRSGYNGGET